MQFFTTGVPESLFLMPPAVSAELFEKVQFTIDGEHMKLYIPPPETALFAKNVQFTIFASL